MSEKKTYPNETLTIDEFSQRTGINLSAAYELARQNKLPVPVIRIGRLMRISRRAFDEIMSADYTPPEQEEQSA